MSLIYEYNKNSPLFVRRADQEIEANNVDKAIQILNEGLDIYPDYAVAFFLLGKAHTIKGNYSQALKLIKKGSEIIHSPKSYDHYLREIEAIKKQRSIFKGLRWEDSLNVGETQRKKYSSSDVKSEVPQSDKTIPPIEESIQKLNEDISETRQTLKSVKQSELNSIKKLAEDNMIISETLAKIYMNQGEFQEAIKIFEKLIKRNPDKADYYQVKIDELIIRMNPDTE